MPIVPRPEPDPLPARDPFADRCSCGLARTPLTTGSAERPPMLIWRACTVCDLSLRFPVVAR